MLFHLLFFIILTFSPIQIVILLQSCLPCSENFFRYKKNYEKFAGTAQGNTDETKASISSPKIENNGDLNSTTMSGDTTKSYKTIASPKIMTKASPVNELWRRNNLQLTVDTKARTALNKYALNPSIGAVGKQAGSPDKKMADENSPVEDNKTNMIPIANFKSNKLSQISKKTRLEEFERIKQNPQPGSPLMHEAIRLPNMAKPMAQKDAGAAGVMTLQ